MIRLECYTGGIAMTNGWLVRLEGADLLVDAPEGVAGWLDERGARVSALLLTHQHFDHVMDAAEVKKRYGCPVLAWSGFSRALTLERLFGAFSGSLLTVPEFEVNEVLEGREAAAIGGLEWRLLHIPGHSADSVCFHQPGQGIVFGGDVLFQGGVGRTDLPGGSFEQLLSGIQAKLLPLPDATRVCPGHGNPTSIGDERLGNPFLTDY
ncbi:MAG TPA: hypothetical protein DIT13_08615 [Verrucomicrobiales bacterium]|nr:hypothetical protein [Verrucomicrobiales bacterium]HRJ08644.1 MBL fold metallo-hydrolase [Prosthecobacter sp.]HRK13900.1 MBL fold metallo-hydrolase [Prosthecobacter sp.]